MKLTLVNIVGFSLLYLFFGPLIFLLIMVNYFSNPIRHEEA